MTASTRFGDTSINSPTIDILRHHVDAVDMSSEAQFSAEKPDNTLPAAPKAELETKPIMKALVAPAPPWRSCETGRGAAFPISLINALTVLEARASTEIENIVTTADRLFRSAQHDESEEGDPAINEALHYQAALMQGLRELAKKPVTTGMAVEICRTLRGIAIDIRKVPDTALKNQTTGNVVYTPPEGEDRLRGAGELRALSARRHRSRDRMDNEWAIAASSRTSTMTTMWRRNGLVVRFV